MASRPELSSRLVLDALPPPPALFRRVTFDAPCGKLVAFLSAVPDDDKKHAAIVWITGGDSSELDDSFCDKQSTMETRPRADFAKGHSMMFPTLRGGHNNPGVHEGFYGEVDDILAAANYLARQPFVDPGRVYLGGMSCGGTHVLLAAECSDRFRAAFAFARRQTSPATMASTSRSTRRTRGSRAFALIRWLDAIRVPVFVFDATERSNLDSLLAMNECQGIRRSAFISFETPITSVSWPQRGSLQRRSSTMMVRSATSCSPRTN